MRMKFTKSYLPTVIVSVLMPFFYALLFTLQIRGFFISGIVTIIFCIFMWLLYFSVVENNTNDENRKKRTIRIICSLIIQFIIDIFCFFIPLNHDLKQPLEQGHHTIIETFIIPIIIIFEPLLNLLWCTFINMIYAKIKCTLNKFLFTRINK